MTNLGRKEFENRR